MFSSDGTQSVGAVVEFKREINLIAELNRF